MDLERLIETWRGPLIGLLAAWGAPAGEARELAEEVFVQAWLSRERFEGDPNDARRVGAWLRGIARNLLLAARRERARRSEGSAGGVEFAQSSSASSARSSSASAPWESDGGAPDSRLAALREALDALDPELREALYVRYVDECSLATVAALLGISERAAEGRLYRGRQVLKERIERDTRRTEVTG